MTFSLHKLIKLAKPITASTFQSIVDPFVDRDKVVEELLSQFSTLTTSYLPWIRENLLEQEILFQPSWKASPSKKVVNMISKAKALKVGEG